MLFDLLTANKLFSFEKDKSKGGYVLTKFAQNNFFSDPRVRPVTEVKIPAKYRGKPVAEIGKDAFRSAWKLQRVFVSEGVRRIGESAFQNCKKLSFISLPSSLEELGSYAFNFCGELRAVGFNSRPRLGAFVFENDLKLPAELILAGELRSLDIAPPLPKIGLKYQLFLANTYPQNSWLLHRPDVLELVLKNNCLCNYNAREWFELLAFLIEKSCAEHLRVIEESGALTAALADELIEYSARNGKTEMTAYLLDYKNRKFGFDGGDKFEL